jgi:hypothetical protein
MRPAMRGLPPYEETSMTTHTLNHGAGASLPRWIVAGFAAGAVSVLVFHQGAAALLHAIGLARSAPWSTAPTAPWGVPQVGSLAFWGGIWGVAFAALLARLDGARLVVAATILGAALPTLVAWFVVAPLKGQPAAAGWVPGAMIVGPIVNAAWGLGTGLGLALFGRDRHRHGTVTRADA